MAERTRPGEAGRQDVFCARLLAQMCQHVTQWQP
jgi:hypothetical protein